MGGLPVAVVGAGPVGLTAALALAQAGVPVRVVEKRPALSSASKASTFHPPTLAILHALRAWDPGRHEGEIVKHVRFLDMDGGRTTSLALDLLAEETPFPYRLHLEQAELTPLLLERLRRAERTELRFGCELVGLDQRGDHVELRMSDGSIFEASLVIGADGARSTVRRLTGIAFPGEDYSSRVLRLMTRADLTALVPGAAALTYVFRGDRSTSLLKMRDCWRIILRIPADVDEATALDRGWWAEVLNRILPIDCAALGPAEADLFAVSKRVAERLQAGRVLLAGDAAHLTNTRGGMNMNCGIHDAWELAGQVARAWRENRPEVLAATAERRRRVAAEQLIPRTDATVSGDRWFEEVLELAADREAATAYLRRACMLDMVSAPSPAAATASLPAGAAAIAP